MQHSQLQDFSFESKARSIHRIKPEVVIGSSVAADGTVGRQVEAYAKEDMIK
jgi:hypothetical protein